MVSDHAPVILQLTPKNRSGMYFKYEAFWDDYEECGNVVKRRWTDAEEKEDKWEEVLARIKKCQKNLQTWHKETFKRGDEELYTLKRKLAAITAKPSQEIDWEEAKCIQKEIDEVWKREEKYWGKRSRLKWLQWGDKNSKFFHATTIQRRERNRLQRIKNDRGNGVRDKMKSSAW